MNWNHLPLGSYRISISGLKDENFALKTNPDPPDLIVGLGARMWPMTLEKIGERRVKNKRLFGTQDKIWSKPPFLLLYYWRGIEILKTYLI